MRKSQEGFKYDFDRQVLETLVFKSEYCVVANNASLSSATENVEAMSIQPNWKFQLWTSGPFRVIKVLEKTLTIDKYGTPQNVPFGGVPLEQLQSETIADTSRTLRLFRAMLIKFVTTKLH